MNRYKQLPKKYEPANVAFNCFVKLTFATSIFVAQLMICEFGCLQRLYLYSYIGFDYFVVFCKADTLHFFVCVGNKQSLIVWCIG